ncbi:MAG: sensor histidine kinase [Bacteroidales bacterium]
MKKGLVTILIYFMALVIVGLVGLQYFFIRVSYEEKDEVYRQHIYSALLKTAQRLNNRQSVMMVYEELNRKDSDSIKPVDPTMFSFTYPDGTSVNIEFDKHLGPGGFMKDELGPEHYNPNNVNDVIRMEQYFSSMLQSNRGKLYSLLEKIESEISIKNIPLSKRYSNSALQSILNQELKNQGIQGSFTYAILQGKRIHPHLKSSDFKKSDITDSYTTRLQPNAFFSEPEYLAVNIPDQRKLILDSISMQITLSVIFVLMILITFFISTYVILRQKRLSEMKNDFISNMTHELKTPIATIRLAADSLLSPKILNNEKTRDQFTDIIKQETRRLNSQVEKVLEVSSLDRGDIKMNLQMHDIHDIIADAARNMELTLKQSGGSLTLDLRAENHTYLVDKEHMTNVVVNLIDNSIKYSGEDSPELHIETYNKNKWLYIAVKDQGIGMDSTTVSRIFDKFYRANSGNIHDVKGFGLGLHYVKEIINAHKGLIDVKSTPGKGSTFIIKLIKS